MMTLPLFKKYAKVWSTWANFEEIGEKRKKKSQEKHQNVLESICIVCFFYLGHFDVLIDEAQHWHFQISIR